MWKCKTCGCQNPDTCTACRMCGAAASNNTAPSGSAANETEQSGSPRENAPKFCGRCGRPLAYGQSTCQYCAGTEESKRLFQTTKSKRTVAVIAAAAIVCVAAVLLLPPLLSGNQQPQVSQAPQTVQKPQSEQNPPANAQGQESQTEHTASAKELYYAYFDQHFGWDNERDNPMLLNATNKYNVFLADLTHDGEDEMIVVDNTMDMDGVVLTVYTCKNNSVIAINTCESEFGPREKVFGLYDSAGSTYLFICSDGMTMMGGKAYYQVVSLTPDGAYDELLSDSYSVILNPETDEVTDEYYALIEKMEEIKQQSYILFDCGEDYVRQSDPASVLR